MIEKLPDAVVEEGKGHDFVVALLRELRQRHAMHAKAMETQAASGAPERVTNGIGGRCAELRAVIELIENAKGVPE